MNYLSAKTRARMFCCAIVITAITVGSGFAIVWLQQQINRVAQRSQAMELQLAEVLRELRDLDERIAAKHQPVALQTKVADTLRPSLDNQIVWVREARALSGRYTYAPVQSYDSSLDLAFLDSTVRR